MSDQRIPALDELRESLREAARRDIEAATPLRRRRRRRRATGLLTIGLLGAAAAAGAAELISAGEPAPDKRIQTGAYRPDGRPVQIAMRARDGARTWGVGVYTARNGRTCALAGRLRGGVELGQVTHGVFHRFDHLRSGECGLASGDRLIAEGRTIVYGLARPGAKRVVVTADGKRFAARTGYKGAFVLVFNGTVEPRHIDYG